MITATAKQQLHTVGYPRAHTTREPKALLLHTPKLLKCHLSNYHVCNSTEKSIAVRPARQRGESRGLKLYKYLTARLARFSACSDR